MGRVRPVFRKLLALLLCALVGFGISIRVQASRAASLEAMTRALAGKIIVIDPGHGGPDPGAVGASGVLEKEVVLEISMVLRDLLNRAGARAILTRDSDVDLSEQPPDSPLQLRKKDDLEHRISIANDIQADVFVSIHANKFPSPIWYGAQTFYHAPSPEGKRLALALQEQLVRLTDTEREINSNINQYVLRNARVPAATVEVGFLSHPGEEALLDDPKYQKRIAWAVFIGLAKFIATGSSPTATPIE